MKKRLISVLLVMAMVLSFATSAAARDSKQGDSTPGVQDDRLATGPVVTNDLPSGTAVLIMDINSSKETIQDIPGVAIPAGKVALTNVFELYWVSSRDKHDGATVTFTGIPMAENATGVQVMHYSTVRNVWEVITPDAVNTTAKTVTATFQDVSPVIIIADAAATSPNTGFGL